jgi:hypothetical protein
MRTLLLSISFSLFFLACSAQMKVALLAGRANTVNIYSGEGTNFEVAGTVAKDEFFYCDSSSASAWCKVTLLKVDKNYRRVQGYMDKNYIRLTEQLPLPKQKALLKKALLKYYYLVDDYLKSSSHFDISKNCWNTKKDSLANLKIVRVLSDMAMKRYEPVLDILPVYICRSEDKKITQLFMDVLWIDRGSSKEEPSVAIGKTFICDPDFILAMLKRPVNQDFDKFIASHITLGLMKIFSTEGQAVPTDPKYIELMKKLQGAGYN